MPRNYRRRRRSSRRRDGAALLGLLVLAALLLLLIINNETRTVVLPDVNMPPLSDIQIPNTGEQINIEVPDIDFPDISIPDIRLPDIQFPEIRFPESWKIGEDTEITANPGSPDWGVRTKTSGCQLIGNLPDPDCTPGALTPVTEAEVCSADDVGSVAALPGEVETNVLDAYGISSADTGLYRVDRLVPLSLGGSNDIANLWPLPLAEQPGSDEKRQVEDYLRSQVCAEQMTLAEAQQQIATNWTGVYNRISD